MLCDHLSFNTLKWILQSWTEQLAVSLLALIRARFEAMTEPQRNRYEAYRRSAISKKNMRKLLEKLIGSKANDKVLIAMSSITKLFLGEVVEQGESHVHSETPTAAVWLQSGSCMACGPCS